MRQINVVLVDKKLENLLTRAKTDEPKVYKFLNRAFDDLKKDPECGIQIPKKLIPKYYIQRYGIDNLWKYNLPNAWRLMYSIKGSDVSVIAVVLEWLPHKEYERRFGYL
ncbi:MAG: hypothetical protein QXD02_03855 [Candidatus Parvarchaeum sp.]|nr:hypothetical protein [Candidatus Parvarchaeum tengchongense]